MVDRKHQDCTACKNEFEPMCKENCRECMHDRGQSLKKDYNNPATCYHVFEPKPKQTVKCHIQNRQVFP